MKTITAKPSHKPELGYPESSADSRTITARQFLEQIQLGAEVFPRDSRFEIDIQVGRWLFRCYLDDLNGQQRAELERLYRARRIRFGYPGDFTVPPFFFTKPLLTRHLK